MGHKVGLRRRPHRGSMQFWPRKRAKRIFPRIRTWTEAKETTFLGFGGYKAGMTHIIMKDNRKHSVTKGKELHTPVTILECPPITVVAIRLYKKTPYGIKVLGELWTDKLDKNLKRILDVGKKSKKNEGKTKESPKGDVAKAPKDIKKLLERAYDIRAIVHTTPTKKKRPEIFEIGVGGASAEEKFNFLREKLGQKLRVSEVFKSGEQLDVFSITTGKGFQGVVKRFGVKLMSHKKEKKRRTIGSLGPWHPAKTPPTTPQCGQMGYNSRCEYNKQLLKISNPAEDDVTPKGGLSKYGVVKNDYILISGSVPGPKKRLIRVRKALRPNRNIPKVVPEITYVSKESQQ